MASELITYCVDTSALVDLPRHYPRVVFDAVWTNLEQLIGYGRFVAPREVLRELGKRDDEVCRWAKGNGAMFVDLDAQQQVFLKEVLDDFTGWLDVEADGPVADPIVIALARTTGLLGPVASRCVVSHEVPGGPGARKIPNVCEHYSILHIRLVEVFVREGWTFR